MLHVLFPNGKVYNLTRFGSKHWPSKHAVKNYVFLLVLICLFHTRTVCCNIHVFLYKILTSTSLNDLDLYM